jgi:hypothetical protein
MEHGLVRRIGHGLALDHFAREVVDGALVGVDRSGQAPAGDVVDDARGQASLARDRRVDGPLAVTRIASSFSFGAKPVR